MLFMLESNLQVKKSNTLNYLVITFLTLPPMNLFPHVIKTWKPGSTVAIRAAIVRR